jgi:hypothetical protein
VEPRWQGEKGKGQARRGLGRSWAMGNGAEARGKSWSFSLFLFFSFVLFCFVVFYFKAFSKQFKISLKIF